MTLGVWRDAITRLLICRLLGVHRMRYFSTFGQCDRCHGVSLP